MNDYTTPQYLERWSEVKRDSASLDGLSMADELALCELIEPGTTEKLLDDLGPLGSLMLAFDRAFWLRPKQLAVTDFEEAIAFSCGGRGGGKTRPAAEWIIKRLEGGARVVTMIGPTFDDIEQFMLGGQRKRVDGLNGSGLFDCMPPWLRYEYKRDAGQILFPDLGSIIYLHSAEVAEYRGGSPDTVWGDELLKWRYGEKLLSNLRLANRDPGQVAPQILITSSPKRMKLLRDLVMDPDVKTIHSVTKENRGNVLSDWVDREERRLGGTRQGAEELEGELGIDDDSDMFKMGIIDRCRVEAHPSLDRIVVAVDPAGTIGRKSDLTGISVCGRAGSVNDGHGYVIEDKSGKFIWEAWGEAVVKLAIDHGASAIVIENNKFSGSVTSNLRLAGIKLKYPPALRPGSKTLEDLVGPNGRRIQIVEVNARTDKPTRAGPVSTLYETNRVHHVGALPELEIEMGDFPNGGASPNRLDAMVHAMTELFALDRPQAKVDGKTAMQGLEQANKHLAQSAGGHRAQWVGVGHNSRRVV